MLRIVSPAAHVALTTLAEVRARADIAGAVADNRLSALIADQSARIAEYCGCALGVTHYRYRHCERGVLAVRTPAPVVTLLSASVDGVGLAADDLDVENRNIRRLDGAPWCGMVEMEYLAGYKLPGDDPSLVAGELPPAIAAACIDLVVRECYAMGRDRAVTREAIVGVSQFDYAAPLELARGLPRDVAALIERFAFRAMV